MNAIHRAVLYLCRLLLSALRKPCGWSLRYLLRLWVSAVSRPKSGIPKQKKPGRAATTDQDGLRNTVTCSSSQVPPELSTSSITSESQDTSTITLSSPTSIRVISESSQNLDDKGGDSEDHAVDHHRGRYISEHPPRASSRASSRILCGYKNSHLRAEEATSSSRPVSQASRPSSRHYDSLAGINEASLHHFQQSRHSSIVSIRGTRPRAHSMVDLHQKIHPMITSKSRSRSVGPSSVRAISPARLQSAQDRDICSSGDLQERSSVPSMDIAVVLLAASPASSPESIAYLPELSPCTTVARYERNIKMKDTSTKSTDPSSTKPHSREDLPQGWELLNHPEGALYWCYKEQPIYTDANLCDPKILHEINQFLGVMKQQISESDRILPEWELVLELSREKGKRTWTYYFVNHNNRRLFWLPPYESESLFDGMPGVTSRAHIQHKIESYYWTHWELFPHNREVPPAVLEELTGILAHVEADSSDLGASKSNYSQEEQNRILEVVTLLNSVGGNRAYVACATGRLMSFISHKRFLNFYGQNSRRRAQDEGSHEDGPVKPSSIFAFLSTILFFGSEKHMRSLEEVYTDGVISRHMWDPFIGKVQQEWETLISFGTVLLAASVSFLAIPRHGELAHGDSQTQIASYLSILTGIGSIITGLVLARRHRNKDGSAKQIDDLLKSASHGSGIEALAVIYGLPYSLLMWAMIWFLTAFILEAGVISTTGVLVCALIVDCGLVVWCAVVAPRRTFTLAALLMLSRFSCLVEL